MNSRILVVELAKQNRKSELNFAHRVEVIPLPVWQVSEERFADSTNIFEAGRDKVDQLASPDYINWRVNRSSLLQAHAFGLSLEATNGKAEIGTIKVV